MTLLQRLSPELKQQLENAERYAMSTEELFSELEKLRLYVDMPYIVYAELINRTNSGNSIHPSKFFTPPLTNP